VSDHTQQCESVVRATTQVNREMVNSTHHHAACKPVNRLSQRLHVIMSWIGYLATYKIYSRSLKGLLFHVCAKSHIKNVYSATFFFGFFQCSTAEAAEPIFTQYIKRRGSVQGCVFSGSEDQNLTCKPSYSRKPPFFDPLLTGLRKWLITALQWGLLCYTFPLRQCRSE